MALGAANGLLLSYLLLPFAPHWESTAMHVGPAIATEDLAHSVEATSGLTAVLQTSQPLILVMVIVLFVLVAVRFIRLICST